MGRGFDTCGDGFDTCVKTTSPIFPKTVDYDFAFLIGNEPHQINPEIYDKENLKYTKALAYMGEINWIIQFDSILRSYCRYFNSSYNNNLNRRMETGNYNDYSNDNITTDRC